MACICGHAEEDHIDSFGPCASEDVDCECAGYEEDEEDQE